MQILTHTNLKDIKKIIESKEFREYPELFSSETLAHADFENIKNIIQSDEFKKYPYLFTSETLVRGDLENIKNIIQSDEFKKFPELFTSTTIACSKIEDIQKLLKLPYFKEEKYRRLLTSTVLSKSKIIISKLPLQFKIANDYGIMDYINSSFILSSPSHNYALINYLIDNNIPLIINEKLNTIFGKQPGYLIKKYDIDIKKLIIKYPYKEKTKVLK